ncbi:PEP motif putative anchor domain protein [Gemmatirosa kalamazoonensis]|uniref:PEP motif putative anchor domain protein n=1 Tax=Gemmatirosa kalamazoonensis TaxID=861299 RepID=W0RJB1_9BACT|nr:PEP-CTERM sorting domain-containing protein [Gemmatirosa kalamazoonensis]AHG90517.1 PEP motif putative anchor domain protein [Gemmatirosa kalamazoonensis]
MLSRFSRCSNTLRTVAVAALSLSAATAGAQSLSGTLTMDDAFQVYLGTSATTLGVAIPGANGNSWPTDVTFGPQALTPGTNYWLQIVATNSGGPGAFIGQFSLTGGFHFANTTQSLLTNTTEWSLRSGSFAGSPLGIADEGPNGTGPWGTFGNISPSAHFIWDGTSNCDVCTIYFAAPIIAQRVTPPGTTVPEPSTWALVATGVVAFGIVRRRRSA